MDFDFMRHILPFMIPIIGMLIPIIAIIAHYVSKSGRERERHETMRQMIKAGQPVPQAWLLDEDDDGAMKNSMRPANPNRSLTPGIINLSVGLGLMGMFALMRPGSWLWGIGLIPACLGFGYLLLWVIERSQQQRPPVA